MGVKGGGEGWGWGPDLAEVERVVERCHDAVVDSREHVGPGKWLGLGLRLGLGLVGPAKWSHGK